MLIHKLEEYNISIVSDIDIETMPVKIYNTTINWIAFDSGNLDNIDLVIIDTGTSNIPSWEKINNDIPKNLSSIYLNLKKINSYIFEIIEACRKHHSVNFKNYEFFHEANLPTKYGKFIIFGFKSRLNGKNIIGLRTENLPDTPFIRTHSMCYTGDIFSSLKCDCQEELNNALKLIAEKGGMIIYPEEEGRGIGILNKIKIYDYQSQGYDTVESQFQCDFPNDLRTYDYLIDVFRHYNIRNINLITNNPKKVESCFKNGVFVKDVVKLEVTVNKFNKDYLLTKMIKNGHNFKKEFSN